MITLEQFQNHIDRFIKRPGWSARRLGKEALGDPSFVLDLRKGRAPSLRTIEKVLTFIKDNR